MTKTQREQLEFYEKAKKFSFVVILFALILLIVYEVWIVYYPTYYVENICPISEKTDYLFFCNTDANFPACVNAKMAFCREHSNQTNICIGINIRDVWVGGYKAYQIIEGNTSIEDFQRHQFDNLVAERYGIWEGKIPAFYNCDMGRFEAWNSTQ